MKSQPTVKTAPTVFWTISSQRVSFEQSRIIDKLLETAQDSFRKFTVNRVCKTLDWWILQGKRQCILTVKTKSFPGNNLLYTTDRTVYVFISDKGRVNRAISTDVSGFCKDITALAKFGVIDFELV